MISKVAKINEPEQVRKHLPALTLPCYEEQGMAEQQPILAHAAPQVIPPAVEFEMHGKWTRWKHHVYFIEAVGSGRVKIGISMDVGGRLEGLGKAAACPFPLALLGTVSADDFGEAELHKRFAEHRIYREWFTLADEIRDFISQHAQ